MELKDILLYYGPLPKGCIEALEQATTLKAVKAGNQILRQGTVCEEFYFIRNGIMRVSHMSGSKSSTTLFATEGDIYTAMHSWFADEVSPFSYDAVTDSEIFVIPYADIRKTMNAYPEFVDWLFRLSSGQLYILERRYLMMCNRNSEERLREFLRKNDKRLGLLSGKNIAKKVPLKYIASYLGIACETLSRLRRKIVQ